MNKPKTLSFSTIPGIPAIQEGDCLADIILKALKDTGNKLQDGDVLVLAQKIVSKAEGRLVNLTQVTPSEEAVELAAFLDKRPELVELILQESNEIVRKRPGTVIVEHKRGFICANAGIDHSNVKGPWGNDEDWVLLLPENPDLSAQRLKTEIFVRTAKQIAVLIIDSHGRAWRNGVLGTTIGLAGMPGLIDLRGEEDLYKFKLRVTTIGVADELAAGASLLMGQASEGTPVVLVRGFPYKMREGHSQELLRPKERDLFR